MWLAPRGQPHLFIQGHGELLVGDAGAGGAAVLLLLLGDDVQVDLLQDVLLEEQTGRTGLGTCLVKLGILGRFSCLSLERKFAL